MNPKQNYNSEPYRYYDKKSSSANLQRDPDRHRHLCQPALEPRTREGQSELMCQLSTQDLDSGQYPNCDNSAHVHFDHPQSGQEVHLHSDRQNREYLNHSKEVQIERYYQKKKSRIPIYNFQEYQSLENKIYNQSSFLRKYPLRHRNLYRMSQVHFY